MPQAESNWVVQILSTLLLAKRETPSDPFLSQADIRRRIGAEARKNSIAVTLNRLSRKKLIGRKAIRGGYGYTITAAGTEALKKSSSTRPWREGTLVGSSDATYELLQLLRPVERQASARVAVYKAVVRDVHRARRSRLSVGEIVVIKTVPNDLLTAMAPAQSVDRDRYLSDLNRLFDLEARKIETARHLRTVAATLDWGKQETDVGSKKSLVPFVVQEYIVGPDLAAYLRPGAEGFHGVKDVHEWFELAEGLVEGLKDVQSAGTFFRYITPSTIFMRGRRPVSVDLMEAVFHVPSWPADWDAGGLPGVDASTIESADVTGAQSFIAPEWRGGLMLEESRRADVYGIGAVLYYVATGRAPRFDAAGQEGMKRSVALDMRGSIADDNYGVADIIARCLRVNPDERLSDSHELLSDIRTFDIRASAESRVVDFMEKFRDVVALARGGDAFASLMAVELEAFERVLAELSLGSVTIRGTHDVLVLKMCRYLSTLGPGDEYWAVTVPDFWSPRNLGMHGRYLSMNGEIIRRGASVSRLFLLTDEDRRNDQVAAIIRAQCELERDLVRQGSRVTGQLRLHYRRVSGDDERKKVIDAGHQCGLWVRGESVVSVRPIYNKARLINRIVVSRVDPATTAFSAERWRELFNHRGCRPLSEWETDG